MRWKESTKSRHSNQGVSGFPHSHRGCHMVLYEQHRSHHPLPFSLLPFCSLRKKPFCRNRLTGTGMATWHAIYQVPMVPKLVWLSLLRLITSTLFYPVLFSFAIMLVHLFNTNIPWRASPNHLGRVIALTDVSLAPVAYCLYQKNCQHELQRYHSGALYYPYAGWCHRTTKGILPASPRIFRNPTFVLAAMTPLPDFHIGKRDMFSTSPIRHILSAFWIKVPCSVFPVIDGTGRRNTIAWPPGPFSH